MIDFSYWVTVVFDQLTTVFSITNPVVVYSEAVIICERCTSFKGPIGRYVCSLVTSQVGVSTQMYDG